MAESWSIIINELADGTITFTPDLPRAVANQPLGANAKDNVTWNNRTNRQLTLRSINPANLYLTEPIPAGQVSDPIFVAQAVTYSCVIPPQPQHSIVVT